MITNLHSTYVNWENSCEEEHLEKKIRTKTEHRKQTKLLSTTVTTHVNTDGSDGLIQIMIWSDYK